MTEEEGWNRMGILNAEFIALDVDVSSSEECIRYAADLFFQHGYVKDGYADAVAAREKVYPTGLPGKGISIAIPHTNNEFVIKPTIGVIVPKRPIKFMMMGTSDQELDCELIFPLVIKDSEMQISMLKIMMKIIQDSALLLSIKQATTKEEIIDLLHLLNES